MLAHEIEHINDIFRRSFGGEDLFYNPWNHSLKRNVEEAVLFFLDEIDDKMDIVNRGIL